MSGEPRQAVILAGGLGTRLRPLTDTLPKPMVAFEGRPFLEHLIVMLRDAGIRRVLLLVGYRGDQIVAHFGDGSAFGVEIEYDLGSARDETGTRLRRARACIDPVFLLVYCDNIWPLDLARLNAEYQRQKRLVVTTVYANGDGWTRDNVAVGPDGGVCVYDRSRRVPGLRGVDIGFAQCDRRIIDLIPDENVSFEATVYPQLVARDQLGAYTSEHRYYSIGSLERLAETGHYLARPPTVLLDRDGTLNARPAPGTYVTRADDFTWLPGALAGLRELTTAGYRVAIVTNQPGVARGALSAERLDEIHRQMCLQAGAAGGRIDAIFACLHGWNDGCACRKPRPGLLFEAQRALRLDLSRTTFIGDDERDAAAAASAGARFVRVGAGHADIGAAIAGVIEGERQCVNAY